MMEMNESVWQRGDGEKMERKIKCVYMRGGTSKACFFREEDLPDNSEERDKVLLRVFGSPDPKQIDGMGGAVGVTSKAAIISISERENADINYDFNQIGIDKPEVQKNANCGNISSAVGPYAIEEGLVPVTEPETLVRIYNKNTGKIIHSHVPVTDGGYDPRGDYKIAGVPGTGAKVALEFFEPQGAVTGVTLPTGNAKDTIEIEGRIYEYSFVDAANPVVFFKLEQFGVDPYILPAEYERLPDIAEIKRKLEILRGTCAIKAGLAVSLEDAQKNSPGLPKMVGCCAAKDYMSSEGELIQQGEIDMVGRFITMREKMAPAFAVTGGICLGVAACTKGTLVNELQCPVIGCTIRKILLSSIMIPPWRPGS